MREHIVAAALSILAKTPLAGQTQTCGPSPVVVTVGRRSISIDSVPPWRFNCQAGLSEGMAIVLYRPADARTTGWGTMYLSEWASSDSVGSFDDRISADVAERRRAVGGDLSVTAAGRLKTRDGTAIVLRHLVSHGTRGTYELVAYAQDAPIIFGVKAFSEATLTATLPHFDRFIQSVTIRPDTQPYRRVPPSGR
jgi:hypothetical protein